MMAISFSKSSLFILPPDVGAVYRNARLKSTLYANRAIAFIASKERDDSIILVYMSLSTSLRDTFGAASIVFKSLEQRYCISTCWALGSSFAFRKPSLIVAKNNEAVANR